MLFALKKSAGEIPGSQWERREKTKTLLSVSGIMAFIWHEKLLVVTLDLRGDMMDIGIGEWL